MANKEKETLQQKAQKAILTESFFRWESAVVISLALLLAVSSSMGFIDILPAWAWLLGGLGAEAALVYSSLTDPEFSRKVVAKLLHDDFHPERLHDKELQRQINQALDYRSRIDKAIRERDDIMLKDELAETAVHIDDWLENIYDLAQRIDRYRAEKAVLQRDQQRAGKRMAELEKRLTQERDTAVKDQIQITLNGLRRQLTTIEKLENTIQRAKLQLENSLTALGTIYSQTMLVDAKDIDSGRAKRLRQDISEEVTELNDVLLAMDEVYAADSGV